MMNDDPQLLKEVWKSPPHRQALLRRAALTVLAGPALGIIFLLEHTPPPWLFLTAMGVVAALFSPMQYLNELDRMRYTGADVLKHGKLARLRRRALRNASAARQYLVTLEGRIQDLETAAQTGGPITIPGLTYVDLPGILDTLKRERDATRRRLEDGAA